MYTSLAPIFLVCIAALALFALFPKVNGSIDESCEPIAAKIVPNTYSYLAKLIDEYRLQTDRQFWLAIGGLRGVWAALVGSWHLLRLIQVHYRKRKIKASEARELWYSGVLQLLFSIASVGAAAIGYFWHRYPHAAALMALSFHREIALRILSLSEDDDAPPSMRKLAEIL